MGACGVEATDECSACGWSTSPAARAAFGPQGARATLRTCPSDDQVMSLSSPKLLLAMLGWLAAMPLAAQSIADDKAWIDDYLRRERAASAGQRALPANALQFADAARWQGRQVRVKLNDGRMRRGLIEQVDPTRIKLRVIVNGGRFVYSIDRRNIHYLLAE